MNEEVKEMVREWKRTKSLSLACDIADRLWEIINEGTDSETTGDQA